MVSMASSKMESKKPKRQGKAAAQQRRQRRRLERRRKELKKENKILSDASRRQATPKNMHILHSPLAHWISSGFFFIYFIGSIFFAFVPSHVHAFLLCSLTHLIPYTLPWTRWDCYRCLIGNIISLLVFFSPLFFLVFMCRLGTRKRHRKWTKSEEMCWVESHQQRHRIASPFAQPCIGLTKLRKFSRN